MRKRFYREVYLKSEHWQSLRLEKLTSVDARCELCNTRSLVNDCHHINYRNLFDVSLDDLVVLCRPCHKKVHLVLEECKSLKKMKDSKQAWRRTVSRVKNNGLAKCDKQSHVLVVTAKQRYAEAALLSNFKFPRIRKGSVITDFFKSNQNATQAQWEQFAKRCLHLDGFRAGLYRTPTQSGLHPADN